MRCFACGLCCTGILRVTKINTYLRLKLEPRPTKTPDLSYTRCRLPSQVVRDKNDKKRQAEKALRNWGHHQTIPSTILREVVGDVDRMSRILNRQYSISTLSGLLKPALADVWFQLHLTY